MVRNRPNRRPSSRSRDRLEAARPQHSASGRIRGCGAGTAATCGLRPFHSHLLAASARPTSLVGARRCRPQLLGADQHPALASAGSDPCQPNLLSRQLLQREDRSSRLWQRVRRLQRGLDHRERRRRACTSWELRLRRRRISCRDGRGQLGRASAPTCKRFSERCTN